MSSFRAIVLFWVALSGAALAHAEKDLSADTSIDQSVESLEKRVAADPDNLQLRYDLGVAYNELAIDGSEKALDKAIRIFGDLVKEDPNMVKAKAMLGSCTVMKAQYVSIFSKLDYVKEGYGILDEAVAADPDNPDLRLIRGANAAKSPGFLGRGDVADEDFEWLLNDVQSGVNSYDDNYRRTIYFYVGDYFLEERDNRCAELLLLAEKTSGAPRLTKKIKQSLKEARKKFPSTFAELEEK